MNLYRSLRFLLIVCIVGCTSEQQEPKAGVYNATTRLYTHDFFGLTMRIPDDWFIPPSEQMNDLMQQGRALVPAHLASEVAKLDTANPILFSAFRYPFDAAESFNLSLMILATPVGPEAPNVSEYLERAQEVASSSRFRLHFSDISEVTLADKAFQKKIVTIPIGPITLSQEYVLCERNNHVFGFVLTYSEPEERETLYTVLRGIDWSAP